MSAVLAGATRVVRLVLLPHVVMVLFDNIKIGQRVEVRWRGSIEPGTIKYKGAINGVGGEWVGVSLDRKGNV